MDCTVFNLSIWMLMLIGSCMSEYRYGTVTCPPTGSGTSVLHLNCSDTDRIHLQTMFFSNSDGDRTLNFFKSDTKAVCHKCLDKTTCDINVGRWYNRDQCTVVYNCTVPSGESVNNCVKRVISSRVTSSTTVATLSPSTDTSAATASRTNGVQPKASSLPTSDETLPSSSGPLAKTDSANEHSAMSSRRTTRNVLRTNRTHSATRPTTPVSTMKGGQRSTHYLTTQRSYSHNKSTTDVKTDRARKIPDQEPKKEGGDTPGKLSTGALAGIAAGALVLLVLVVVGVCVLKRRLLPSRKRKPARSAQNPGYESNHVTSPSSAQKGLACDDIGIQEEAYAVITDNDGGDQTQKPRHLNEYENTKACDYDRIRFRDNNVRFIVDPGYGTLEHVGQEDVDSSYSHINLSGKNPQSPQSDLYSHLQNSGSHCNKRYPDSDTEDLYNHCNDTRTRLAVDPDIDCYSHLSSSTRKPDP